MKLFLSLPILALLAAGPAHAMAGVFTAPDANAGHSGGCRLGHSCATATVACVALATGTVRDDARSGQLGSKCHDSLACEVVLAANHDSSEISGFLKLGRPIEQLFTNTKPALTAKYKAAIETIPDFGACVTSRENERLGTDSPIDWQAIRTVELLEVCVFRVAAEFQDPIALVAWLRNNKFVVVGPKTISPTVMRKKSFPSEGISVSALLNLAGLPEKLFDESWGANSISLGVSATLTSKGSPVDVSVGINYK